MKKKALLYLTAAGFLVGIASFAQARSAPVDLRATMAVAPGEVIREMRVAQAIERPTKLSVAPPSSFDPL